MHITILGRQPALSLAELEMVFGADHLTVFSRQSALVSTERFSIARLGGTPKAGLVVKELSSTDWSKVSQEITSYYSNKWSRFEGKITLGISAYGFNIGPREVQKTGIVLKQKLKKSGVSLRLIPNAEAALNTAVSHHNKLGLSPNKVELLIIRGSGRTIIAESIGAQNITAYAKRDQGRPKRDPYVGMLPPKLAQTMINLAASNLHEGATILDPFCGTGVVLQEAALMGFRVYGTDLSEKMIRYSRDNINWLADISRAPIDWYLHEGDATNAKWQGPIDAIVCEAYLGQPFSAPPSPKKLDEVRDTCNHIISEFLKNLHGQIKSGTPLCVAIPAWRDKSGRLTHLPLVETIARLGFRPHEFHHASKNDLIYYREDQVVARELLVLTKNP